LETGAKVLVVDDEPNILRSLAQYLSTEDFNVEMASSGMEALEKVESFLPELILLDVMMPGMDGFEVLDKIKSNPAFARTPVIMLTARDQSADVLKGYQSGATAYQVKPFDMDELLETIAKVLAESRAEAAEEQTN
jgi:two-component system KDP operon response regulator KdpE